MVIGPISRRMFMKGVGALAGSKALPRSAAKFFESISTVAKADMSKAPPWIQNMVNILSHSPGSTHANGMTITNMGSLIGNPRSSLTRLAGKEKKGYDVFSVKTVDGNDDLIHFKDGKDKIHIKFDISDKAHSNQHILIDKKTGSTHIIDGSRWSGKGVDVKRTGVEDRITDVSKPALRKQMILAGEKPDDYMYDYMSPPSNYSTLWERYVDSFSPAGNIFHTKSAPYSKHVQKLRKEKWEQGEAMRKENAEIAWEHQFRDATVHGYKGGGIINDVVPPLDPHEYQAGGIVKGALKYIPSIVGKGRKYMEKLAKPKKVSEKVLDLSKGKIYQPPKGPYTVTDESGVRILDREFQTLEGAQLALKDLAKLRTQDASTFKIFGGRPPKTAEGVWEAAPEVELSKIGKRAKIVKEKTPAMFWKSRDEIYNAPQEKMMGEQWLGYLRARGVRPAELDDSSLEPFLMSMGRKGITKKELLKEFDEIAPTLEVLPLGKGTAEQTVSNVFKHVKKMDADAFDPKVGGLVKYLQGSMHTLKEGDKLNVKAAETIAGNIDDYMAVNFGIKNALSEGIVQGSGVPWALKYPLINLASAFNRRGVSYIPKTYAGKPNYGGAQVLSGGDNTQEFLFRYNPGKLRVTEPTYKYNHDFGLPDDKLKNGFVHLRTSDRTDEFGRRMLFMEEIQSDMHQPIQRALREAEKKGKKLISGYANRADKVVVDDNMKHLMSINSRIEEILSVNPKSPALKKLYEEREKVRAIVESTIGKGGGSVPQGPFQKSQDYMEFVSKYLVRMAKDGNYDGVGFSTSAIKNKGLYPGDRSFQGNLEAYGSILQNALKGVAKKSDAKLMESVIKDGEGRPWRIPFLLVKDPKAQETISKGMSLYKKGGLVKKISPYGIMEDVVGPL
jgi:hypothetical protein